MTLKRISLAVLSGLLLISSFPPFNLPILVWFALVPLFLAIKDTKIKEAANLGAITGLVLYSGSLWWFIRLFGLSITCLGLFSLLALFIALFSTLHRFIALNLLTAPIIWVAIEFFRSECYPLKFTWLSLGYSQGQNLPLLQSASLFGVYGISFLIVLVNATIARSLGEVRSPKSKVQKILPVIIGAIVIGVFFIYGKWVVTGSRIQPPKAGIKVAIIQDESHSLSRLSSLTLQTTKERVDLVIWPEYSLPYFYIDKEEKFKELANLAKEVKSHLIVGVIDSAQVPDKFINKALIFSPQGDLMGEYIKIHTVQFVESLLIPGREARVFNTSLGKLGIELCYDLDYTDLTRALVKNGAGVLIVPNYDPKRWGRVQHIQHSALSPLRAVEARRYIVRVASSGISQIIDPYGRIIEKLDFGISDILIGEVKLNEEVSFYARYGFIFPYLCQGVTILLFLSAIFKRKRM